MNPTIVIISKNQRREFVLSSGFDENIYRAAELTSNFFSRSHVHHFFPKNLCWAFYDRFFLDIGITLSKIESLFGEIDQADEVQCIDCPPDIINILETYAQWKGKIFSKAPIEKRKKLIELYTLLRIALALLSLVKLAFLYKRKSTNKLVFLWTGDYLGNQGYADPRLGELEQKLIKDGYDIQYLIRTQGVSIKKIINNFRARRGVGIYYDDLHILFPYNVITPPQTSDFEEFIFVKKYLRSAEKMLFQIDFWKSIFEKTKPLAFISWFYSSRTASLIGAAKQCGIPTIGFMHGVSVRSYMCHEFIKEFRGQAIGPDYFGTWSTWWKNYFIENSSIYPREGIQVSGPLRPIKNSTKEKFEWTKGSLIKVFIVSEGHMNPEHLGPYIEKILHDNRFEITFKIRPFGRDAFWEKVKEFEPFNHKSIKISRESSPEAFINCDIVLGSHSTAVLEALTIGKPIALINTPKWGDYFSISQSNKRSQFWIDSPESVVDSLIKIVEGNNMETINEMAVDYFGQGSATEWILKTLSNL